MRALPIFILSALLLGAPALATRDANEAFLWSLLDGRAPADAPGLADAVRLAAARASAVDLSALAPRASPAGGPSTFVGDVWAFEVGEGACAMTKIAEQPIYRQIDGKLTLYSGWIGSMSTTHGDVTALISVTGGYVAEIRYDTAGFTVVGNSDMYCFEWDGGHFAFPFNDGYATWN